MDVCRQYTARAQAVQLPAVVRYGAQDGGTCRVTFPVDARSPGTAPRCGARACIRFEHGLTVLQRGACGFSTIRPANVPM